jgi:hypothetical protein
MHTGEGTTMTQTQAQPVPEATEPDGPLEDKDHPQRRRRRTTADALRQRLAGERK